MTKLGIAVHGALLYAFALSFAQPASAQQALTFFFQTSIEPFMASEDGGSSKPARGSAATVRPIVGLISNLPGDATLTVLGGASATRYAETPDSNADSLFGMANLSKTIEGTKIGATFLAADSRDPTFATGVAKIYDTTLSVSRAVTVGALGGWTLTPQLKASRRFADAAIIERWNFSASVDASHPVAGGTFTVGGGYDWLDYLTEGRHDDKFSVSSSWMIDINTNVQIGVKAEAYFMRSNLAGNSVDALEIGPTLKILFAK